MIEYDLKYYDGMLRNYSATAKEINSLRWKWVEETKARTVLDYGSGIGWFRAFAPPDVEVDTVDAMPVPQTGIQREKYDLLTLWDVLEHLQDMSDLEPYLTAAKYVAISIPILPEGKNWLSWKHFKPFEHLFYPTADQLAAFFAFYQFEEIKCGQPECPPRLDIWNFLYKNKAVKNQ